MARNKNISVNEQRNIDFVNSIVDTFNEYKFTFKEVDDALFFIDLGINSDFIKVVESHNDFSKQIMRDIVLLSRGVKEVENFEYIKKHT